jgi:hypothetical protein
VLELNFKVSARKMAGMVIILLFGWGIISFSDVLWSAYSNYKSDSSKTIKSGHWGDIVTNDVLLDLPDELVVLPVSSKDTQWFFEGYTWAMVLDLLKSAQLSDQALHAWITETPRQHDTDGIRLMPTDQQILDLSPETRSILYPILTGMSANADEKDIACFKEEMLNQQLQDSRLSQKSIALLKRLLYRNPGSPLLIFSDWYVALRQIPDEAEKRLFMKTLSRKPSLLAEIRITPDSNIDQLANYWGVGGRRKDIEPLLSSIKNLKTNVDLSLMYLLPAFVRDRIYTYPFPSSDGTGIKQDCFWTAFNTFNLTPDDKMCEMDYIAKTLEHEYYKIYEPSQLGDIICLSIGGKKVIHAAIFITADIVFTKNGYDFTQPWVLMRKQDMLDTYAARYPTSTLQSIYFRKRTI